MKLRLPLVSLLALAACHTHRVAQTPPPAPPPPASASLMAPKTVPPGIDASAMDWKADPCEDFFQYSCGAWLARTEIPADKSVWYLYGQLEDRNEQMLRGILEASAAGKPPEGSAYPEQLGSFYATCMDEAKLEDSLPSLQRYLRKVASMKTDRDVAAQIIALQSMGGSPLFGFGAQQDYEDASKVIGGFDQGGIGLPDRDYYLKDDAKMKEVLELYRQHLKNIFVLLGTPPDKATHKASDVIALETQLAQASLDKVSRRDPHNVYHPMTQEKLASSAPGFPWGKFMQQLKLAKSVKLNVSHVPFFVEAGKVLKATPVDVWKSYLTVRYAQFFEPALPKRFQDETFQFASKALTGAKEDRPRWKKCVKLADGLLGEALARPYVKETFGPEGKKLTQDLVHDVEASFEGNLAKLTWMDAETKTKAVEKLHKVNNKLGYPDKWKSYDGLVQDRSSFLNNLARADAYESARDIKKIGKPLDRTEWDMTPPTINAYYNPSMNEMVIPAGILQPPLFNTSFAPSVNFGSTGGGTVGHELTHGFDDEGRQFDGLGNLKDWWTPASGKAFNERASCVANEYDQFVAVDNLHVNGKLTLGEDVADLGGVKLAYEAFQLYRQQHPDSDGSFGLTPNQAYFVAFGQSWCEKSRPETKRVRVQADPHAPPLWRVNGTVMNLKSFQDAFACKAGSKMVSPKPCEVW